MDNETSFIGMEPLKVKSELGTIDEMLTNAYQYARDQVSTYNRRLVENWYSPKAKENERLLRAPIFIACIIDDARLKILRRVISSAQIIATKMGEQFEYTIKRLDSGGEYNMPDQETGSSKSFPWTSLKESGPHGVGMNKTEITKIIDELKETREKICAMIENMPLTLSLYDETGDIAQSYNGLLKSVSSKVSTAIKAAIDTVTVCYETERSNVETGTVLASQEFKV